MFDALKLTGHVPPAPPAGQSDLRTLYAQRFAPFAALDTPALVPFENYLAKTDVSPLLAQNRAVAVRRPPRPGVSSLTRLARSQWRCCRRRCAS